MQTTSGSSSRENAQSSIELVGPLTIGRLAFLMALGALTVLFHRTFHYPLHLPGHHGLEAMAILVLGRLVCSSPFAATLVSISTVVANAATGGEHDLSAGLLTLAPGLVLDLMVWAWPNWRAQLWVIPLMAAIGYGTKPLLRLALSHVFDVHFGSLQNGVLYPLSTHIAYGFVGGLVAVTLWRATMSRWRER